jgi:hypothetical protein
MQQWNVCCYGMWSKVYYMWLSPEENVLKVGVEEFQELAQEILLTVTAAGHQRHQ